MGELEDYKDQLSAALSAKSLAEKEVQVHALGIDQCVCTCKHVLRDSRASTRCAPVVPAVGLLTLLPAWPTSSLLCSPPLLLFQTLCHATARHQPADEAAAAAQGAAGER